VRIHAGAVARSTSFTMDWDAAPWVGLTCASGRTTVPVRRHYVPDLRGAGLSYCEVLRTRSAR
jgi:hypothetical protein